MESNSAIAFFFVRLLAVAKVPLFSQCSLVISVANVESLLAIPGFYLPSTGGFAGALQLPAHSLPVVGSALEAAHLSQSQNILQLQYDLSVGLVGYADMLVA